MRCCAPFCRNALDNVPASQEGRRISFHCFPSDARLRAAWLSALGKQGAHLPDPTVVCSQHFLDDDIHETESGSWQIDAGAIPSTVLVCMMCLDTDSKMFLMSKHKLEEAYEYLTGCDPNNQGNLKQTLCVQCAQRLMNFSRFRDQSLRARALMMDLVEKHELITRRHVKMINRTKHRLKSPMVVTTLGADFCDLHIQEDASDDKQTQSETTTDTSAVKTEESDDSMVIAEDLDVIYKEDDIADNVNNEINEDGGDADYVNSEIKKEDDNTDYVNDEFVALHDQNVSDDSIMLDAKLVDDALLRALQQKPAIVDQVAKIQDLLKFECADFKCLLCSEEFVQDLAYLEHMSMHAQSGSAAGESGTTGACERRAAVGAGPSLPSLAEIRPDTVGPLHRPDTAGPFHRPDTAGPHDGRARADVAHTSDVPLSLSVAISNDSEEHLTEEADASPSSEQATTTVSGDLDYRPSDSNSRINDNIDRHTNCVVKLYDVFGKKVMPKRTHTGEKPFLCRLCDFQTARKTSLRDHTRIHTGEKPYSCKLCEYKAARKSNLVDHMRIHTGEKPYSCQLCEYKSTHKNNLVVHMKKHTGEKPHSCKLCEYKAARKSKLVDHMRIHTGEKPHSCKLCEYKAAQKSSLVVHMKKHTGEKPYSCKLCEYKAAQNSNLVFHMKKHTGEKPYSCELCDYNTIYKRHLVVHMKKHTGEKPYSCELCDFNTLYKNNLVVHMKKHTGEKHYSCKLCEYKATRKSWLVVHMKKHTGEKPYSCELCDFNTICKSHLVVHMKKHTGEKPYSCELCDFNTLYKNNLVVHMKKHTGEKPYSCKLCEYKATHKSNLVLHMKKHTGEKPYSCELCEYEAARKHDLVVHMKKHTGEKP